METGITSLLNGRPMPRKLADPLCTAKPYYFFINLTIDILIIIFISALYLETGDMAFTALGFVIISIALYISLYVVAFPKIATNALYLRNFSKDKSSEDVREYIEVMLGESYRLSGIRDPRKRINLIFRPIIIAYMALQYAGARFLNLEAGNDWKARIWSNFSDIKIVFIDLRELTDFVQEEIELCIKSLELERIVFIANTEANAMAWKTKLSHQYNIPKELQKSLHVIAWEANNSDRTKFMSDIERVTTTLPEGSADLLESSFPLVDSYILSKRESANERISNSLQIILGASLLGILVLIRLITAALSGVFGMLAVNPEDISMFKDSVEDTDIYFVAAEVGIVISTLYVLVVLYYLFRAIKGKFKLVRLAHKFKKSNMQYYVKQFIVASFFMGVILSGFSVTSYGVTHSYEYDLKLNKSNFESNKIDSIEQLMWEYIRFYGKCPDDEQGLKVLYKPNKEGIPYIESLNGRSDWKWREFHNPDEPLIDVWGNPYQYKTYYEKNSGNSYLKYIIYSFGEDGLPKTSDDMPIWWDGEGVPGASYHLDNGVHCEF